MIKLVALWALGDATIELDSNDGQSARWPAAALIARATVLTAALADPAYLDRAFIEPRALAWPNGLELSAAALHRELDDAGAPSPRSRLTTKKKGAPGASGAPLCLNRRHPRGEVEGVASCCTLMPCDPFAGVSRLTYSRPRAEKLNLSDAPASFPKSPGACVAMPVGVIVHQYR